MLFHFVELLDSNQTLKLKGSSVYVEARKKAAHIRGHVNDPDGDPLAGVKIAVDGLTVTSNEAGYFELTIPGERLQPNMTIEAFAPGYMLWDDTVTCLVV